ncbi:MAG: hypothetical protein Q9219_003399 [cf. Caloplaca sp. 3 TL-2023]
MLGRDFYYKCSARRRPSDLGKALHLISKIYGVVIPAFSRMSIVRALRRPELFNRSVVCVPKWPEYTTWHPMQRLQDSTVDTFRIAAFLPSTPAKLHETSFAAFPASSRWFQEPWPTFNHSYLGQFSDQMIQMELTSSNLTPDAGARFQRAEAPFGLFLRWTEQAETDSPQRLYVAQASINKLPKLLQDDLPTPELVVKAGRGDVYDASIWLGIAPTYTPLHRDPNPNIYVQLAGRKVVRLVRPEIGQSIFETIRSVLGEKGPSIFRGDEMMEGREKELLEAEIWQDKEAAQDAEFAGLEVELDAGEGIFIPQGWWHSVRSTGKGCTASVRWTV